MFRHVPNLLTFVRLALIPLFVVLMIAPSAAMVVLATIVFIIAAITDLLDGYLARRYGAVSDLGKLLDPLADKLLVMAALVMLVAQRSDVDGAPWVPGWMVVTVLGREIWVTGIRGVAAARGRVMAAGATGKVKSWLQMVAIIALLLHEPVVLWGVETSWKIVGLNLLFVSIAFSLWSAIDYTVEVFEVDGGGRDERTS